MLLKKLRKAGPAFSLNSIATVLPSKLPQLLQNPNIPPVQVLADKQNHLENPLPWIVVYLGKNRAIWVDVRLHKPIAYSIL